MADADRALDRIDAALRPGERIAIWGDYDADGMTAIVVWVDRPAPPRRRAGALRPVSPGGGLRPLGAGLRDARRERRAGSSSPATAASSNAAEVEVARALGLDVVITDHHLPPAVLPRAVAVVDPHRPDCAYPDPDLTGAGLAYKLAAALLCRGTGFRADGLAAVAAIGTIADMAPMTGESRAIVRLGPGRAGATSHAGLRALLARAVRGAGAADGARPRLRRRAAHQRGRPHRRCRARDGAPARGPTPTRAEALATSSRLVHERRRELTTVAIDAARLLADGDPRDRHRSCIRDDAWAPGLLGLVAGRLADELARPVAAAALVGDEVRGSVRAPADFHVAAALEACATT